MEDYAVVFLSSSLILRCTTFDVFVFIDILNAPESTEGPKFWKKIVDVVLFLILEKPFWELQLF